MRTCIVIGTILLVVAGSAIAQTTDPRFQLTLSGGEAFYSQHGINDVLEAAEDGGLNIDQFHRGPDLGAELEYYLSPRWSMGLGANYVWENAEATADVPWFLDINFPHIVRSHTKLETTLIAPFLGLHYHNNAGDRWDYSFGGGIAYLLGNAKLTADTNEVAAYDLDMDVNGVGMFVVTGVNYEFNAPFTIGAQVGYRHYDTENLKDYRIRQWSLDLTGSQYDVDLSFSGMYLQATLGARF